LPPQNSGLRANVCPLLIHAALGIEAEFARCANPR